MFTDRCGVRIEGPTEADGLHLAQDTGDGARFVVVHVASVPNAAIRIPWSVCCPGN